jgi:hypothetical protein
VIGFGRISVLSVENEIYGKMFYKIFTVKSDGKVL